MDQTDIQHVSDPSAAIAELLCALGERAVLTDPADCARYASDQSGLTGALPLAVVRPHSTGEVAEVLRLCTKHRLAVVPQGGRTGLSGGGCGADRAIVLSSERMTGIVELDPEAMTITVMAGTPLETVQNAALEVGLEYPVDIGARGSATIGGTIATNAGGIRVLQYGMTRANVLGLEAVLADGSVISRLGKTVKDNAGFDLKHLFIGSEGTLGIVTQAVLQLRRHVPGRALALLALRDHGAALSCLGAARDRFGTRITAFEGMWPDYWDFVCHATTLAQSPLDGRHGFYLMLEVESEDGSADEVEALFADLFERELVQDGVLAQSVAEMRALWSLREAVGEVDPDFGYHINFDIGLSPSALGHFCAAADTVLADMPNVNGVLKVGHVGDGNVHLLVGHDGNSSAEHAIEAAIYDLLRDYGGSVTAEHGVGRIKAHWIGHSRSDAELALMRGLKAQMDPLNLLNPGAVLGG
ncbi:MAG: FAD-binding oxidoreductase [Pseudomonadota bacterium]|nr:FAD-binding oxidoreductase [Pseudomonadota bacterium]